MRNKNEKQKRDYSLHVSIALAVIIISGAMIYNTGKSHEPEKSSETEDYKKEQIEINKIRPNDHVLGNPDAKIIVFEYSDFECPFCKEFYPIKHKIVNEYEGEVAWVYRHFVLGMFPNSKKIAMASECAAEIGGSDFFWKFANSYFSDQFFRNANVETIANDININETEIRLCVEKNSHIEKINKNSDDARKLGGQGVPHTVITGAGGEIKKIISGAYPYEDVKFAIEELMRQ